MVLLAASGTARAADNTIAVLGLEATDGAPESVATLVTDALRQRATSERGMKLVPGKDLVDIKLIFSCPDEAPTCMADAAKNLGVSRMIFGSVKRAPGDSYVMTLKMLDVNRRQVVAWVGEPLSRTLATPGAIRGPVEKWFATLTGQSTTGTVRVRGDMPGISVALDGAPMGVTSGQEMMLNNVPAGRREIVASKPGYAPIRKEVSVLAGGTVDVDLDLGSAASASAAVTPGVVNIDSPYAPVRPDEPGLTTSARPSAGRDALKWGSWATAAASVASFALAVKFALDVQ
ncbi:MAG TPA: PEGA domain-containing protein, partial [Polyangia bacterium]